MQYQMRRYGWTAPLGFRGDADGAGNAMSRRRARRFYDR